jgi:hypothetical protein
VICLHAPCDELDSSCHIGIFNLSSVWRVTVRLAVTTAQQPQLYCLQFKSLSIAFVMDKRMPYHARLFPCPYQCGLYCCSAAGLTQHHAVCAQNPANVQASESTSGSITGISPPGTPPPQTRTPTTHASTPPVASPTSHTPEFLDVGVSPQTPPPVASNMPPHGMFPHSNPHPNSLLILLLSISSIYHHPGP